MQFAIKSKQLVAKATVSSVISVMSLFGEFELDQNIVNSVSETNWNIKIETRLKSAQNQTYKGILSNGSPCIVRVTPFSEKKLASVRNESAFLVFAAQKGLEVCAPIATPSGETVIVHDGKMIFTAYPFAAGEAINYFAFTWITDEAFISALGQWMGRLHKVSQEYALSNDVSSIQTFRDNLSGTLKTFALTPEDEALLSNPQHAGVLHGDVNCTNLHYAAADKTVHVFDWDQMQTGHFLYDLTQPIWGVVSLLGGSPIDKQPVPLLVENPDLPVKFARTLITAYEHARGDNFKVDIMQLMRMMDMRVQQYRGFCSLAVEELKGKDEPGAKFMAEFCEWVVKGVDTPGLYDMKKIFAQLINERQQ